MAGPNFEFGASPQRRPRRRSPLRIVGIVAAVIAPFACCGTCITVGLLTKGGGRFGSTTYPSRVTERNFNRIGTGWTYKKVEELLGPTTEGGEMESAQIHAGNVIWEDGVRPRTVPAKDAELLLWSNYPSMILMRFDQPGIPPPEDAKVVWKAYWMHSGNKVVYLTESNGTERQFRLP